MGYILGGIKNSLVINPIFFSTMKNKLLITLSLLLLIWGCDESSTSVFSLTKEDFNKEMKDSMVLNVESPGSQISLKGSLKLFEGECIVTLKAPSGDTLFPVGTTMLTDTIIQYKIIYNTNFKATNTFSIDEKFDRILGKWTFNYEIKMVDNVEPEGSFDFVIEYND